MSLILEALRKSEAERRRGQVPDLHAEPSPGARPLREGPSPRLWLALALATAVVLAIVLWLSRSTPTLPSRAVETPVAASGPGERRFEGSGGAAGPEAAPIDPMGSSGMPEDRASTGASPPPVLQPSGQSGAAPKPVAPPAAAAPTNPTAPAPATAEAGDPAAPRATIAPAPPRPPPVPADVPAPDPAPAAVVSTTTKATPASTASGSAPLRLSDLTFAQREQLPPLKMSMHMYSPTQRFAIIDGSRVAAGDRIGGAVVREITADGVVLDWQGQRLQIPIR